MCRNRVGNPITHSRTYPYEWWVDACLDSPPPLVRARMYHPSYGERSRRGTWACPTTRMERTVQPTPASGPGGTCTPLACVTYIILLYTVPVVCLTLRTYTAASCLPLKPRTGRVRARVCWHWSRVIIVFVMQPNRSRSPGGTRLLRTQHRRYTSVFTGVSSFRYTRDQYKSDKYSQCAKRARIS